MNHLFLASTPFNAIISALIAHSLPSSDRSRLWLIDQPTETSEFVKALHNWKNSPFELTEIVTHKARNLRQKINRKHQLHQLATKARQFEATHLYTGNDRRIEFQYLMANQQHKNVTGHYIDDGTYTYIGRDTHWLKDQIIDATLKKLIYGCWWCQPETIGASAWVSHIHVAFPKEIVPALQKKIIHDLPKGLNNDIFIDLAASCLDDPNTVRGIKTLAILPHESLRNSACYHRLTEEINRSSNPGIKDHPRNTHTLSDINEKASKIAADLPMEIILPILHPQCRIIGDVSTALLTAKWLRPELNVVAYADTSTPLSQLMNNLGIQVINEKR
ncbi:hypothetical protein [Bacterioplanoides pacificum]|uniref:Uncharacterized protein n=1 Tax=Bacterioplanoides pacificum TaxID=1171596 RepID=A0ABV7VSS9_9GAMM